MTLLSIRDLSLRFGAFEAVKHISVDIRKGEMLAIVGESGSGKSLTALSCLGLQPPGAAVSGSIRYDGQELLSPALSGSHEKIPAQDGEKRWRHIRGKRIGMVFQEPMTALNPLHTIGKQMGEMFTHDDSWIRGFVDSSHRKTDTRIIESSNHRIIARLAST